jgi:hypothetical protein
VTWSGLHSGDDEIEYRRGVSGESICRKVANASWLAG